MRITYFIKTPDINDKSHQMHAYMMEIEPVAHIRTDFREKFEAFGFDAVRIDGHDLDALYEALTKEATDKPIAIVLDTVKGKGIKEVEETMNNHSMGPDAETFTKWIDGLKAELNALG